MRALVIAMVLSLVAIPSAVYGDNSKIISWKSEQIEVDEEDCQDAMDKGTIIWRAPSKVETHIYYDEHMYLIAGGFGGFWCQKYKLSKR